MNSEYGSYLLNELRKFYIEELYKEYDVPLPELTKEGKINFKITDKKLLFHINEAIGGKGCLPIVMQDMNKIIDLDLCKELDYNSFTKMYDMSNVYDISSLVYAKRLRKINLSNNKTENMFMLGFCQSLKEVYIRNTNTSTTYFLKNLGNLEILDLSNNNIEKLLYIENMKNIKKINIAFNPIKDYMNIEKLNYNFDLIIDKNQEEYISKLKNYNNINITVINEIEDLEKLDLLIKNEEKPYLLKSMKNRKDTVNFEKTQNIHDITINYEDLKKYKNLLFVENDEISKKEYIFNKEIENLSKEDCNDKNKDNDKLSKEALQFLKKGRYEEALNIYTEMTDFMTNPNVYRNIVLCYKNLIKKEENLKKRNLKLEDNEHIITIYKEKRFEYAYKAYLLFSDVESSVLDLANIYLEMDEKIEFNAFTINKRPELLKAKLILEKLIKIKQGSTGAEALLFSIVNGYKWNSCDKNCIYNVLNNNGKDINKETIKETKEYPININDYNKYILIKNSTEDYVIRYLKEYSEIGGEGKETFKFKYYEKINDNNSYIIIKCPYNISFYNYHNLTGWLTGFKEDHDIPDLTAVIALNKADTQKHYYATLDTKNSMEDTMIGVFNDGTKFSQYLPEGVKEKGNIVIEHNDLKYLNVSKYLQSFQLTEKDLINLDNSNFKTINI